MPKRRLACAGNLPPALTVLMMTAPNKSTKILYWASTGLLSAMMLMSAGMYVFNHEFVAATFSALGYPTYLIYPLAAAKLLGIIAILTRRSKMLQGLAYAGFFYDTLIALAAHLAISDGEFVPAMVAMTLVIISYTAEKRLRSTP